MPKIRDRFHKGVNAHYEVGERMTRQEFKDESDINKMMDKYVRTGTVATRTDMAKYGDFSAAVDFKTAQEIVIRAKAQFATLASELRSRFDNDPEKFLGWIHSKEFDLEDAQRYGILSAEGQAKVASRVSKREADKAAAAAAK